MTPRTDLYITRESLAICDRCKTIMWWINGAVWSALALDWMGFRLPW